LLLITYAIVPKVPVPQQMEEEIGLPTFNFSIPGREARRAED